MCSYNSVNGNFACENPSCSTDILRGQWGFDGFVVSDYGANHSAGRRSRPDSTSSSSAPISPELKAPIPRAARCR